MTTTFCLNENSGAAACPAVGEEPPHVPASGDLARLHRQLSDIDQAVSHAELVERLAPVFAATSARFVGLCDVAPNAETPVVHPLFGDSDVALGVSKNAIFLVAQKIIADGQAQAWQDSAGDSTRLAAWAVSGRGGPCLVAAFDRGISISQTALFTLQAVALQIAAWRIRQDAKAQENAAQRLAALTELLSRLETAPTLPGACRLLADELQSYLGCQQVVVGLCREGSSRCRVEAISGVDAFHPHSERARVAQAALQEAIVRGGLSLWPAKDESSRFGLKALGQFAASTAAEFVVGTALCDDRGEVRGAWLLAGSAAALGRDDVLALFAQPRRPWLRHLDCWRAQPGWLRRLTNGLASRLRKRRGQAMLAATALAVASLFAPVPHRVKCDCQLEPVTRRFVAAPFDGPLKETFVEPGDLVAQGQLLARMDGREVRWELAGVQAELHRAAKQRAGHVASHEAGAAEVARHEVDRFQFREQLLKARDQDLDIRSPVEGIVVTGDLKDAEGMPLKVGDVLFEVAPLDAMIVELAVPEDDVTHVRGGMPVRITFDAFPFAPFEAEVERVHPRAELRDEQNVFIAEVRLDNSRQALHPGMRGHARIEAGEARLGWILFRRPLAAAIEWLGW